jgi:cell division protease FtsH
MKLFKSLCIALALATAISQNTKCTALECVFDLFKEIGMQRKVWKTYGPDTLDAPSEFVTDNEKTKKAHSELIDYLQHPEQYADKKVSRGVLIEGPLNQHADLFLCGLVHKSSCSLIVVRGEQLRDGDLVASLFEEARQIAPCIIFIDNLFAMPRAMPRTPLSILDVLMGYTYNDEPPSNTTQLLVEMCNLAKHEQPFVVIATINSAGSMDEAFRGYGRFDQVLSF